MIHAFAAVLVVIGLISFCTTTIGIIRFPDFYARMHAAGKGDVTSSVLIFAGIALYNVVPFSFAELLVSLKIMLIPVFIFLASPTATHAIIDAGFEMGIKPWSKKEGEANDDMAT